MKFRIYWSTSKLNDTIWLSSQVNGSTLSVHYSFDRISTPAGPGMSPDQQNVFKDLFSLNNLAYPTLYQVSFAQHHSIFLCSIVSCSFVIQCKIHFHISSTLASVAKQATFSRNGDWLCWDQTNPIIKKQTKSN